MYDRFDDGKPASKQECRRRLFHLLTRSKRIPRLTSYTHCEGKTARKNGMSPQELGISRRKLSYLCVSDKRPSSNPGWKIPRTERQKKMFIKKRLLDKKKREERSKRPRLDCWRYKEEASLDEPFEYREISEGCNRWRMNRVADRVPQTASLQAQILDPRIGEGPKAGDETTLGYCLRASLTVCIRPSTTSFVNLGMALKAPAGMNLREN